MFILEILLYPELPLFKFSSVQNWDLGKVKSENQYSTSVTKIKAATYEIKWIEDLVRNLWSPMKEKNHCGYHTSDYVEVCYGHLEEEKMDKEEDDEVTKELNKDVNMNLGNKDTEMTNADQVPKITSTFTTSIPPPPTFFNPLPQKATPTTSEAITSFPSLPDFSSVFRFNDRVTNLEKDL
uniref:Uncharacterized protein n=1 Tax=Tanacetum cinerariifolium TaxID=118510 RepID=A0A699JBT7_TANCI|nr:hypothetical protein [Tanacetum cinerariifolium]